MHDPLGSLSRLRERYGEEAVEFQLRSLERHGNAVEDPRLWLEVALEGRFKFMPISQVDRCPCGNTETRLTGRFVFWNLLALRECGKCGLLIVSPRLTKEAMRSVFTEYYFDYANLSLWGDRRARVFADVLRILKLRGARSVFDVGAAFGHFVKYAREMGLEAAGSDISPKAVEVGRAQLGVDLYAGTLDELSLQEESLDAIVSLDAFYYVPEPRAELDAMRRLLKPGGVLVLRLRNSIWSRVLARTGRLRTVGPSILPAQHLWGFTPQSITYLLEISGWRVEECLPAAYSMSRLAPLQAATTVLNRVLRQAWHGAPILTRSFNVVARRAG